MKEPDVNSPPADDRRPALPAPDAPGQRPRRARRHMGFSEDFRRFFLRGLSALLPTLITLWLLIWVWSFLWENLGRHIIAAIVWAWSVLVDRGVMPFQPLVYMRRYWWSGDVLPVWLVQLIGVGLAILLVYMVGLLVGNLIGRTIWRLAELAVMRVPLVRAIYPAVKQVTDFLLAERKTHFEGSRVVAVQREARNVWSIGLVTGAGVRPLSETIGQDMVTVFIPSTPTSFSGYVVVVPRDTVVELPLKVEEAMRLLVSGGVIVPDATVTAGGPAPAARPPISDVQASQPPAQVAASSATPAPAPELLPPPPSTPLGARPFGAGAPGGAT